MKPTKLNQSEMPLNDPVRPTPVEAAPGADNQTSQPVAKEPRKRTAKKDKVQSPAPANPDPVPKTTQAKLQKGRREQLEKKGLRRVETWIPTAVYRCAGEKAKKCDITRRDLFAGIISAHFPTNE